MSRSILPLLVQVALKDESFVVLNFRTAAMYVSSNLQGPWMTQQAQVDITESPTSPSVSYQHREAIIVRMLIDAEFPSRSMKPSATQVG